MELGYPVRMDTRVERDVVLKRRWLRTFGLGVGFLALAVLIWSRSGEVGAPAGVMIAAGAVLVGYGLWRQFRDQRTLEQRAHERDQPFIQYF